MENMRLKIEQERLREKLVEMESKIDVQNLLNKIDQMEIQHREKQMSLMLELEQKDKQINKVNIMFQNIKSQYQKLENEAKVYNTVLE